MDRVCILFVEKCDCNENFHWVQRYEVSGAWIHQASFIQIKIIILFCFTDAFAITHYSLFSFFAENKKHSVSIFMKCTIKSNSRRLYKQEKNVPGRLAWMQFRWKNQHAKHFCHAPNIEWMTWSELRWEDCVLLSHFRHTFRACCCFFFSLVQVMSVSFYLRMVPNYKNETSQRILANCVSIWLIQWTVFFVCI